MAYIVLNRKHIAELLGVACRMGSHSVSCMPPDTDELAPTSARQAGTRFTQPRKMELRLS